MEKEVHVQYVALFRDQTGKSQEAIKTDAPNAIELYAQIQHTYKLPLSSRHVKIAINDVFCDGQTPLQQGDRIIFLPPAAGG
jgi:molybdopterin converting factor small subunit